MRFICRSNLRFVSAIATVLVALSASNISMAGAEVKYTAIVPPASIEGVRVAEGGLVVDGTAGKSWRLTKLDGATGFQMLPDRQKAPLPENSLPDGLVSTSTDGTLQGWLTGPTRRYDHGVLGDDIEASGFRIRRSDGNIADYQLSDNYVFEDRQVRFHDLDGDGTTEILAIKSGFDGGGRIAAYSLDGNSIRAVAESAAIGRAHRWLNLISVADFDGDGKNEIAAVITPHLGVVLRLFRLEGGRLLPVLEAHGFSNHGIGMRDMQLSAVADVNGDGVPDLIVPDAARTTIRIVTFAGGTFRELYRFPLRANITGNMALVSDENGHRIAFPMSIGRLGIITIHKG